MAYDESNQNWEGTGTTEAAWRKRYPTEADNAAAAAKAPATSPLPQTQSYAAPAPAGGGRDGLPYSPAAPPAPGAPAAPGAAPAVQMPTPLVPKPGPDWLPTQDGLGWVPSNHPAAWKPPVQPLAAPAPAAAPAPGGPAPETVPDVFRQQLMALMKTNTTDVSQNDPAIRAQSDAFSAQRQIARRQEQEALAEHLGAQGLSDSGAMDTGIQQSFENAGRDTAGFTAGLVGTEISQRRDMLKTALALAGDRITQEERMALERQLADLDAQIKREGIASSAELGRGDLDARRYATDSQSSLGLLNALMQNEQFNNDLGFRIGNAEQGYNRDLMIALMGGRR